MVKIGDGGACCFTNIMNVCDKQKLMYLTHHCSSSIASIAVTRILCRCSKLKLNKVS